MEQSHKSYIEEASSILLQIIYFIGLFIFVRLNWEQSLSTTIEYFIFSCVISLLLLCNKQKLLHLQGHINWPLVIIGLLALTILPLITFVIQMDKLVSLTGSLFTYFSSNLMNSTWWIELFMGTVPIPFIETIAFQGTIQIYLERLLPITENKRWLRFIPPMLTATAFALFHIIYGQTIAEALTQFFAGLVFSLVYLRTQNIRTVAMIHGTSNLLVTLLSAFFPIS
ncbi:CPBP family intramembrane glutamic endopeptidase [Weissella confusa]|uniref:CPBP family glutamic-type intramembrane protease n=2 Tax=Weissella confusa TaxID=1583 RepID=UPI0018F25A4C|nr:CPBP family intramembrane metalloprotease [Weissella confusa]MBJ7697434.1 CPBP family intramembrane metalloprotease [Weissella confusa]